eukprot:3246129-Alexandrium_andersonii.AAC.1
MRALRHATAKRLMRLSANNQSGKSGKQPEKREQPGMTVGHLLRQCGGLCFEGRVVMKAIRQY